MRFKAERISIEVINAMQADQYAKTEENLIDIRKIYIDRNLSQQERIRSFVRQVGNPYAFKVGDVTVKVSYADCNASLNDRFADLISLME